MFRLARRSFCTARTLRTKKDIGSLTLGDLLKSNTLDESPNVDKNISQLLKDLPSNLGRDLVLNNERTFNEQRFNEEQEFGGLSQSDETTDIQRVLTQSMVDLESMELTRKVQQELQSENLIDYMENTPRIDDYAPDLDFVMEKFNDIPENNDNDALSAINSKNLFNEYRSLHSTVVDKIRPHLTSTFNYINSFGSDLEVMDYISECISKYQSVKVDGITKPDYLEKQVNEVVESVKEDYRFPRINKYTVSLILFESFKAIQKTSSSTVAVQDILTVYNQCKESANLDVFIYGFDIDIFNLLIELVWSTYMDLQKVEQIVLQARLNGVVLDDSTLKILDAIFKDYQEIAKREGDDPESSDDVLDILYFMGSKQQKANDVLSGDDAKVEELPKWNRDDRESYKRLNSVVLSINRKFWRTNLDHVASHDV